MQGTKQREIMASRRVDWAGDLAGIRVDGRKRRPRETKPANHHEFSVADTVAETDAETIQTGQLSSVIADNGKRTSSSQEPTQKNTPQHQQTETSPPQRVWKDWRGRRLSLGGDDHPLRKQARESMQLSSNNSDLTGIEMSGSGSHRRVDWAGNVEETKGSIRRVGDAIITREKLKDDTNHSNNSSKNGSLVDNTTAKTVESEEYPSVELTVENSHSNTHNDDPLDLSTTHHDRRDLDEEGSHQRHPAKRPAKQWISFARKRKPNMTYETFVWVVFAYVTVLAIVDRFTSNAWPRQVFSIGGGSAGTDRLVGFKPGPWSVVAYDIIARVSGRFSICCFNLLLITRLRCLEHWILSTRWINDYLDCSNITKANLRIHKWNAIALCVLTLIHVWSILLPCLTHGYTAKVIPGTFEYPLSERAPPGFKDADPEKKQMGLQVDDIWRMVEMTVLLCILTPLSVRWLSTKWHIGMPLHRLITVLYFVDIVRRHSHPHSWVLNTPVFCVWIFDKFWFWYSNRNASPEVHRATLGRNYMALYWKQHDTHIEGGHSMVSPDYFLRLRDSSFLESAHVFTCFENRTHTTIQRDNGLPPFEWTVGCVVRVFREQRTPQLGQKDPISHTARMYDVEPEHLDVTAWGPYHSEMSSRLRDSLLRKGGHHHTTLIGTGSGIGYIVDVLQWRVQNAPKSRIKILFSTRDVKLFQWARQTIQPFANLEPEDGRFEAHLALTGNPVIDVGARDLSTRHCSFDFIDYDDMESEEIDEEDDMFYSSDMESSCDSDEETGEEHPNVYLKFTYHKFEDEIPDDSWVFSQANQSLNEKIAGVCKKKQTKFYGGLQAPERIDIFDSVVNSINESLRVTRSSLNDLKASMNWATAAAAAASASGSVLEEAEEERPEGRFGRTFQRRLIGGLLAVSAVSLVIVGIREVTMGETGDEAEKVAALMGSA